MDFFFLFGAFELVWHAHPDKRPFLLPTAIEIQKCCVVETDNGILSVLGNWPIWLTFDVSKNSKAKQTK